MMRTQSPIWFKVSLLIFSTLLVGAFYWSGPSSSILLLSFVVFLIFFQYLKGKRSLWALLPWMLAIVLGVFIGLYHPPSKLSWVILDVAQLHPGGAPFHMEVNYLKTAAGYLILLACFVGSIKDQIFLPRLAVQIAVVFSLASLIIVIAYFLLPLEIHLKTLSVIAIFALANLLMVCVVEEAFMRLLLQEQLHSFLMQTNCKKVVSEIVPVVFCTLLFVVTHGVTSFAAIIVFGVAGFCYAAVYSLTKNLWASVSLHFLVNLIHFAFFTYPLA